MCCDELLPVLPDEVMIDVFLLLALFPADIEMNNDISKAIDTATLHYHNGYKMNL
jgi:hypothetical protein